MEKGMIRYDAKTIKINSIISLFLRILGYAVSFLSAPVLISLLGDEKYGIWVTLLSFTNIIYTFDFGIGRGMRNKIAECLSLGEYKKARGYATTAYVVLSIISVLIFCALAVFIYAVDIKDFLNIAYDEENIKIILLVAILLACINFVSSLIINVVYAVQKVALANAINFIGQLLYVGGIVMFSMKGIASICAIAIVQGLTQLIKNIAATYIIFHRYPQMRFSLKDYDQSYKEGIVSFGIQIFVISIAGFILSSTDNIIITKYIGSADVTPYSICLKYFGIIEALYVSLFASLGPAYTAAYARSDYSWIKKAIKNNLLGYCFFVLGIVLAAYIFKPFAKWWLRRELVYDNLLIIFAAI